MLERSHPDENCQWAGVQVPSDSVPATEKRGSLLLAHSDISMRDEAAMQIERSLRN